MCLIFGTNFFNKEENSYIYITNLKMKITIACSYHPQGFHWVDKTQHSPNNMIRNSGFLKF